MADYLDEVGAILRTVEGAASVFFYWPQAEAKYPCVTYYEANNSPAAHSDDRAYAAGVNVQVDVWGDTPAEVMTVAARAVAAMQDAGWAREFQHDLYDGTHRKTMRFMKLFFN